MKEIKEAKDAVLTTLSEIKIYEKLSKRNIYINSDIVCRAELNPTEMCLLGLLYTMSNATHKIDVSVQWLADTCHISLSTAKRELKKLEDKHYFKSVNNSLNGEKVSRKTYIINEETSLLFDLPYSLSNLNLLDSVNLTLPNKKEIKKEISNNLSLSYTMKEKKIKQVLQLLDNESIAILKTQLKDTKSYEEIVNICKAKWIDD